MLQYMTPKKPGRGGKRPGAGRPPGSLGYGGAARKYGISLPGELAARLDATAAAEGIRPGAWIRRVVIRALESLGGKGGADDRLHAPPQHKRPPTGGQGG